MATLARRQGGWIGLIALLLALVIVALLGKTLLQQMGLFPNAAPAGTAARGPGVGLAPTDDTAAAPTPTNAVDRAKSLGQQMQQQAEDLDKKLGDK
jgi:hypothetical protein